jgi:hypothetical protein
LETTRGDDLPVVAYVQEGIALEGVREKIILNPVPFKTSDEVLEDLRVRLGTWRLKPGSLAEPLVEVRLDCQTARQEMEHHVYETKIVMTNLSPTSHRRIRCRAEIPPVVRDAAPRSDRHRGRRKGDENASSVQAGQLRSKSPLAG